MGKGKRAGDDKYPAEAKVPMEERLGERGNPNHPGGKARANTSGRNGREGGEKPINPRNPHINCQRNLHWLRY